MSKNKECTNKNSMGGVITFNGVTGRNCKKSNPTKKRKLDKFYWHDWHEALDRTALVAEFIETTLLDHPVFNQKDNVRNKQLRQRVIKAQKLILETYQEIGDISLSL